MQSARTKWMSTQSRWAPFCVESKASAKPAPSRPLRRASAGRSACLVSQGGSRNTWPAPLPFWIREAHCYHPGVGRSVVRLKMTNWLEGVSEKSRQRNILWTEKCILGFDKRGTLYGQVYKSDSHNVNWSRIQRHLYETSRSNNGKVFILESHPQYDWIRELFSMQSLFSWPKFE